ncbi:MAG: hypothetical protein IKB11_03395 [Bacteroidaceae bacterium]|nr:hypothetical protein [Bacteroidaceae bacterium]
MATNQRTQILLSEINGTSYSYADIAVAMCVSVNNVRNYIHAARVALRKMLGRWQMN